MDVAKQIAANIKEEGYDIIFVGRETIDYNGAEVGAMLAELLDLPYISYANGLTPLDGSVEVSREIEGGVETVEVSGSLVVSASKGMAEQRIPNMRGIMMAKRKPLKVVDPIETNANISFVHFTLPEERTSCQYVDSENMDELVRLLHEEAKVI
jgi:electron transfer flavoprotein beta subunit